MQINKLSPLDPRGVSSNQTWLAGKSSINGDCPASHVTDYRSVCHCNRIQPKISRDINNKPKISAPKIENGWIHRFNQQSGYKCVQHNWQQLNSPARNSKPVPLQLDPLCCFLCFHLDIEERHQTSWQGGWALTFRRIIEMGYTMHGPKKCHANRENVFLIIRFLVGCPTWGEHPKKRCWKSGFRDGSSIMSSVPFFPGFQRFYCFWGCYSLSKHDHLGSPYYCGPWQTPELLIPPMSCFLTPLGLETRQQTYEMLWMLHIPQNQQTYYFRKSMWFEWDGKPYSIIFHNIPSYSMIFHIPLWIC